MKPLTDGAIYSREELQTMLTQMRATSAGFYAAATRIHCHAFIEFAGLMNEFINVCAATLEHGDDFTQCNTHVGQALRMSSYHASYLAEKLDCIYGPSLAEHENKRAFLEVLFPTEARHGNDEQA